MFYIKSMAYWKASGKVRLLHSALLLVVGASFAFGYASLKQPRTTLHTQVASLDFLGLWPHSPIIWDFFASRRAEQVERSRGHDRRLWRRGFWRRCSRSTPAIDCPGATEAQLFGYGLTPHEHWKLAP